MGLLSFGFIGGWDMWGDMYIRDRKATGGNIRHDKLDYTGADGRAQYIIWDSLGDGYRCAAGIAAVSVRSTKKINMVYAGARKGHPTPPAFAMQSRHIFCNFRFSGMG
jgi:hypothetical protein